MKVHRWQDIKNRRGRRSGVRMDNKVARIVFWCTVLNTLAWGLVALLFWASMWAWSQVFV